jgi:hypothetical protein
MLTGYKEETMWKSLVELIKKLDTLIGGTTIEGGLRRSGGRNGRPRSVLTWAMVGSRVVLTHRPGNNPLEDWPDQWQTGLAAEKHGFGGTGTIEFRDEEQRYEQAEQNHSERGSSFPVDAAHGDTRQAKHTSTGRQQCGDLPG